MIKELKPKKGQRRFQLRYTQVINKEEKEFLEKLSRYFDYNDEWDYFSFAIENLLHRRTRWATGKRNI